MSGILDPKTRILDTILTNEGRRQLTNGKLKAEFYSFSDAEVFYATDENLLSGSDVSGRISFEIADSPNNTIALEVDDSGKLQVKELSGSFQVRNGMVFTSGTTNVVTGTIAVSNVLETVFSSSLTSFQNLQIFGLKDPFLGPDVNTTWEVFPKETTFLVTSSVAPPSGNVEYTESLFLDKKLSHIQNFKFLPPVNKPSVLNPVPSPLGTYNDPSQFPIESFEELQQELTRYQKASFSFQTNSTVLSNQILCQMFEIRNGIQISKLDVIDFGLFSSIQRKENTHVFFVGKIFQDSNKSHTFVNLFTLIFKEEMV